MKDWAELVRMCPLFSDLPEERVRQALLSHGTLRQYAMGETLIGGLEQVDWFGVVLEGRIEIVQVFPGGASSLMETLLPSYALGIDLVFTKSRRSPYRAAAAEPSRVMIFPSHVLTEPGPLTEAERMLVWRRLLTMLSQANMRKHNRLSVLCQRGLRERILSYLTLQSVRREEDSFQISFSREEMAGFLCVNRSALSHELSQMEREGLIRFRKNRFTLLPKGEEQLERSEIT